MGKTIVNSARTVSATEMNQQGSRILSRVADGGESLVVVRNGRPVATIQPYSAEESPRERLRRQGWSRQARRKQHAPFTPVPIPEGESLESITTMVREGR